MPQRAQRFCSHSGCRIVVVKGKCARHATQARQRELERQSEVDARRPAETRGVYSSPRWLKERARFLHHHPLCPCGEKARYVDHVKPWRSGATPEEKDRLFWDVTNWQPMCGSCHSSKTAARDGGFGNARRTA